VNAEKTCIERVNNGNEPVEVSVERNHKISDDNDSFLTLVNDRPLKTKEVQGIDLIL
jgi:hypothetical protein